LEQDWAEPLHEYSQFASIIKKLLAYRHQKHVQYEMIQESLESKRENLEEMEKSEREARRLEDALGRGRPTASASASALEGNRSISQDGDGGDDDDAAEGRTHSPPLMTSSLPPHPGPNPRRRSRTVPGMGLINALSYTLHGIMDVDPETARRNNITKTRESIAQVSI
jgi:sorting nexin-41/42